MRAPAPPGTCTATSCAATAGPRPTRPGCRSSPGCCGTTRSRGPGGDHAIRFTTDESQTAHIWPARHDAGSTVSSSYPPMGARFRLEADFPTAGYRPDTVAVLNAMKTYGLVLADNGSPWYFQGTADRRWPSCAPRRAEDHPGQRIRGGRHRAHEDPPEQRQGAPTLTSRQAAVHRPVRAGPRIRRAALTGRPGGPHEVASDHARRVEQARLSARGLTIWNRQRISGRCCARTRVARPWSPAGGCDPRPSTASRRPRLRGIHSATDASGASMISSISYRRPSERCSSTASAASRPPGGTKVSGRTSTVVIRSTRKIRRASLVRDHRAGAHARAGGGSPRDQPPSRVRPAAAEMPKQQEHRRLAAHAWTRIAVISGLGSVLASVDFRAPPVGARPRGGTGAGRTRMILLRRYVRLDRRHRRLDDRPRARPSRGRGLRRWTRRRYPETAADAISRRPGQRRVDRDSRFSQDRHVATGRSVGDAQPQSKPGSGDARTGLDHLESPQRERSG